MYNIKRYLDTDYSEKRIGDDTDLCDLRVYVAAIDQLLTGNLNLGGLADVIVPVANIIESRGVMLSGRTIDISDCDGLTDLRKVIVKAHNQRKQLLEEKAEIGADVLDEEADYAGQQVITAVA